MLTYVECAFVALVTQHAKRMRRIILLSVACQGLTFIFFSTLSNKRHDFRERFFEYKMRFNFLYSFLVKNFLFLRIVQ